MCEALERARRAREKGERRVRVQSSSAGLAPTLRGWSKPIDIEARTEPLPTDHAAESRSLRTDGSGPAEGLLRRARASAFNFKARGRVLRAGATLVYEPEAAGLQAICRGRGGLPTATRGRPVPETAGSSLRGIWLVVDLTRPSAIWLHWEPRRTR